MRMSIAGLFLFWTGIISPAFGAVTQIDLVCDEWPPYQIVQKENASGFSVEIVTEVLHRMKVRINSLRVYPWKRAVLMIEKGMADALFSANWTPERDTFAWYPEEPLIITPWVMWVRKNASFRFDSFEDLLGKRVGVVRGYSYTPAFWDFLRAHGNYEEMTSDEQNFNKLAAQRVDYVLAELGNGLYLLKNLGLSGIHPLKNHPVKTDGLYLIFHKKRFSKAFTERFSETLRHLKGESVYREAYDRYFGF